MQHGNRQLASNVWWKNGRIAKSFNQSQKKSEYL